MSSLADTLEAAGVHVQRFNENDAASAATDPRHGSTTPAKDMEMNKHVNTIAAPPAATIIDLAAQLGMVYRANEVASDKEWRFVKSAHHLDDRYWQLKAAISMHRAASMDEAAIQLAEIINLVDMVLDQFPEAKLTYDIKRDFRALERMLHSVLELVDSKATVPVSQSVHPDFRNAHLSPWPGMQEATAAVIHADDEQVML